MKLRLALVICALAISGCAAKSQLLQPPACPERPPLPQSLRQPLHAERSLSQLLLESEPPATPESRP